MQSALITLSFIIFGLQIIFAVFWVVSLFFLLSRETRPGALRFQKYVFIGLLISSGLCFGAGILSGFFQ